MIAFPTKSRSENRKSTGLSVIALVLVVAGTVAQAQQSPKVPRIGVLAAGSSSPTRSRFQAFRERLRELGYIEGQNIAIEYRYAEGKSDLLPELARDLVRQDVSIIITTSTSTVLAAKEATSKVPIVAASSGDLVGTGLIASLARPGGNVTGLTAMSPELSGKRLELLKEIAPKISRIAVLWYPSKWDESEVRETEIAAQQFGLKIQSLQARSADELQTAYGSISKGSARAIIIIQGPFTSRHRIKIVELSALHRLPSICDAPDWVDAGCLASYGPNRADLYRRAATYVDKILKGATPADLPVEQPIKFELVINLKTAKQIGLIIPPKVLARADRVIK